MERSAEAGYGDFGPDKILTSASCCSQAAIANHGCLRIVNWGMRACRAGVEAASKVWRRKLDLGGRLFPRSHRTGVKVEVPRLSMVRKINSITAIRLRLSDPFVMLNSQVLKR